MPYLGKTPSQATRQRYYKTASGGETSLSGTMTVGGTLTFSDGEFVDVSVNGVALVAGTDYNTTTANTIGGLSALSANDQVEIVVYDTFSVFGGNVDGDFNLNNGTMTLTRDDNSPQLIIKSTDADADVGPEMELFRDSASPANSDVLGQVQFRGKNDAAETVSYAEIDTRISDVADGTEDGELRLQVKRAGTTRTALSLGPTETVFNDAGIDNDFRVESDGNVNMLFVDAGNNRVGIGKGSPSDVLDIGIAGDINISDGNLKVASGHGIDFSATSNSAGTMQNELLDDYEEGTWTPTATTNAGNAASFTADTCLYTKIGRMVFVKGSVRNIDTSGTTGSSTFRINGFPFTIDVADSMGSCTYDQISMQGSRTQINPDFDTAEFVRFVQSGGGTSETGTDHSDITSGATDIFFTGFYYTNQ